MADDHADWDGWQLIHSDHMAAQDTATAIMPVMESAFDPAFGEAWTLSQLHSALCLPHCRALLALDPQGQVAGFSLTRQVLDEQELLLIAVAPWARCRGIGRLLIETIKENAPQLGISTLFLEMRYGNPAERLYRDCGFVEIGRRPNYYTGRQGQRYDAVTYHVEIRKA